jgi:O-antigen/teichoic acid export membrane protein
MAANMLSMALAAIDHQGLRAVAVAMSAALNVGLNVYFIPPGPSFGELL